MSLINQMLQDLERRRASGGELGALPNQIRVLPEKENPGLAWRVTGMAGAVALVAFFGWRLNQNSLPQPLAVSAQMSGQMPGSSAMPVQSPTMAPLSRLSLELERVPDDPPVAHRDATPPAAAPAQTQSPVPKPVAVEVKSADRSPAPAPVPTTTVIATSSAAMNPAPIVVKTESVNVPVLAPVEVARPALVAMKQAGSLTMVDMMPDSKALDALGKPQIDKRAQILSPQQLAENDYREAVNFLNQGRLAEAQDGFRRVLQHSPAHVGARQGLFGLLLDARKNGEAEQLLQEGLQLNPGQSGFAMALASLQYQRGDLAGAIETMQRSALAAQSNPEYVARLAGLLQRQARHREAIENYQAALRLAPGSGVWLMGLGISLQALNRTGEAQDAFRRARATNTLNPELQAFVDQRLKQIP